MSPANCILELERCVKEFGFIRCNLNPDGSSPEQLAATVKADSARLGKLIRDAGIREE